SSRHSSAEGVAAYDAACNQRAEEAGLPGPYRAWISTTSTPAERRFANARGFIRLDGRPFMDALDPNAPVAYPVAYDETGQRFTGLGFDGMFLSGRSLYAGGAIATCHDWTSASQDWR